MDYISLFFIFEVVSKLSSKDDIVIIVFSDLASVKFFVYLLKKENSMYCLKKNIISGAIKNNVIRYRYRIAVFSLTFVSQIWQINTV